MTLLNKNDFSGLKSKNKIAIFGCGHSINNITDNQIETIKTEYDTMAFNWFCLGKFPAPIKYYLVHVQGVYQSAIDIKLGYEEFITSMKADVAIILKKERNKKRIYAHHENTCRFNSSIIFTQSDDYENIALLFADPFDGAYNPRTLLGFALQIAIYLRYNEILFAGIDLYDQNYFWCKKNETWALLRQNNWCCDDRHPHADETLKIINEIAIKLPNIKMYTHNPKSELIKLIPAWNVK